MHTGWYAESDECFYTEQQVADGRNPKSGMPTKVAKETGNAVAYTREENYMFRLSAFKDKLHDYYVTNPDGTSPRF